MKAVVFHGKGDLRVEDRPEPDVVPGRVKVRPRWCGICGTDLHEFLGGPNLCPAAGHPHPLTQETVPLIFGHEFSGEVEAVGAGVTAYAPGDRVCILPTLFDGTCQSCEAGMVNCCDRGGFLGLSGWGGGLAEHVVVPETSVLKLPDAVSMEIGALIEPLAVGWHAVRSSPFAPGGDALVLGGGPIGLCIIQALRAQGAQRILVSEVAGARKEHARRMGATHVLDPTQDDVPARAKEICGGSGPDVAFDCAGVQASLDAGLDALRPRGTLVNVAIWEGPARLDATKILLKEKKYQGIVTYTRTDYEEVLDAITAGKITPEGMITKRIGLDDVYEGGFRALIDDKANQVKILVDCHT